MKVLELSQKVMAKKSGSGHYKNEKLNYSIATVIGKKLMADNILWHMINARIMRQK